jgi:hypothetical protein
MATHVRTHQKLCHELVAATAKEMAGALYEALMADDEAYADWQAMNPDVAKAKLQGRFIARTWPKLIEQARATLAKLLNTSLNDDLKDQIAKALILDNTLLGRPKGAGLRLN